MSYTLFHSIIVTTYLEAYATDALRCALQIFPDEQVSPIRQSHYEKYFTFFIGPDGAKDHEGCRCPLHPDPADDCWTCEGDDQRERFITWLDQQRFEDGSCPYTWVEVRYTSDSDTRDIDCRTKVTAHSQQQTRCVAARKRWAAVL